MKPIKTLLRRVIARQLERRVQQLIRDKHLKVVAVTGSVGKTSTKLAVAAVLRQKYRVLAQEGNYNSEIGLPLSIFEMTVPETLVSPLAWLSVLDQIDKKLKADYPYDVLVLEMGADRVGEIQHFMSYISPDVGIVTAIEGVHLETFGSIDNIAHEKMALAKGSKAVLVNAENKRVMEESKSLSQPFQSYGVEKGEVHFDKLKRTDNYTFTGSLILNDGEVKLHTNMIGRHSLASLAAAAAVGEELGLDPDEIKAGVEFIQPFAGRMQMLPGLNGSMVIDDTYNAAPTAVIAALETLQELPGRHIAILGNMNELGDAAERAHRKVGAAAKGVDLLITIGKDASTYLAAGAAEAGLKVDRIHRFDSPYEAGEFAQGLLRENDFVLVKGSQNGVFSEEAAALLLASPLDRKKLVRQSPDWQKKKRAQFS